MTAAKTMTDEQIVATLRHAAMCERNHKGITYDHGTTLVDLVAVHGDRLADAFGANIDPKAHADVVLSEESDRLIARVAQLREALKPFADAARRYVPYPHLDDAKKMLVDSPDITLGDLRRASAVLSAGEGAK